MKNTPTRLIIFVATAVSGHATAQQLYSIQKVAPVQSSLDTTYFPSSANAAGILVGSSVYSFEVTTTYSGQVFNPPAGFPAARLNWHYGINDSNNIAGAIDIGVNRAPIPRAAAIIGGVKQSLGTATSGTAYKINASGTVLGSGSGKGSLWTWNSQSNQYTTVISGPDWTNLAGKPSINNLGHVAAYTPQVSMMWDATHGVQPLPSGMAYPTGINDSDDVVANNTATGTNTSKSYLKKGTGELISFSDLTGGKSNSAFGVDDTGRVGLLVARSLGDSPIDANIWDPQLGLKLLHSVIQDPNLGFSVSIFAVYDMNLHGQISCLLHDNWEFGQTYYAVLNPTPAPGALGAFVGAGMLVLRRRR